MIENIVFSPELRPVSRLGWIEIDDVQVAESSEELKALIRELADRLAVEYGERSPGEIDRVKAVRAIFHKTGLDPTRHRPSSESLLRRAVKGKGLYFVNRAVDLVNYFSLRTLFPMGLYDADYLRPPIEWRAGTDAESYEGIGRDRLNLVRFPVLADSEGPFGSPVSDSMRTRVTEVCTRLLWVTFAPAGAQLNLDELASTMVRFSGGVVRVSTVL